LQISTPPWVIAFLAAYFAVAFLLFLYGMHAYVMAGLYVRALRRTPPSPPAPAEDELPRVTVQLPLYNERYVARRLLETVARFDYPREKLEIQVLDDSTDDTALHVAEVVSELRARGVDVVHRLRTERTGYKGGALREGLAEAKGDLVAIFDADFVPPPDFLRRTVPHFADPGIGLVQTRWTHLNETYSLLTRVQAVALDAHFLVEHLVRNRSGAFINFNGTAGIWRKQAILDAGNWQDETLTEDLDLSYRAQLAGWRFRFLPEVECPAELPAEANGLRGQQFRWAKGSVQTARKLLPRLVAASLAPFCRFQAFVHLTNHFAYPLLLVMGITALPALWALDHHPETAWAFRAAAFLVVASFGHPWLYLLAQRARGKSWRESIAMVPPVVAANMGIAINNTRALWEGIAGRRSPFLRTPKYALVSRSDRWRGKTYRVAASVDPWLEILLALYALVAIGYALGHGHTLTVPFLALYVLGPGYLGVASLAQARSARREAAPPVPSRGEAARRRGLAAAVPWE